MPVDYSRFEHIVDSEDEDGQTDEAPVAQPTASRGTPSDVMDDLNDYFSRLEERRRQNITHSAPPSVDRFEEDEISRLERVSFRAASCPYTECSVCLADFAEGESLIQLPCAAKHLLHSTCASNCLLRSALCPLCRVDLRAIVLQSDSATEVHARPVTPRQLGYTRDGGVILKYEPNPPGELPRPSYIPPELHDQASYVEISYPRQGVARVWRVPREMLDAHRAQVGDPAAAPLAP